MIPALSVLTDAILAFHDAVGKTDLEGLDDAVIIDVRELLWDTVEMLPKIERLRNAMYEEETFRMFMGKDERRGGIN